VAGTMTLQNMPFEYWVELEEVWKRPLLKTRGPRLEKELAQMEVARQIKTAEAYKGKSLLLSAYHTFFRFLV
jgi:hypothetical protein